VVSGDHRDVGDEGLGWSLPSTVTTWGAVTNQVLALREHLIGEAVRLVVWRPPGILEAFHYLLEDGPFQVMLVNAQHAKNLPGRKTDVSDAAWLAQLGAHGLVPDSFVPPKPIRALRDLTRTRTTMVRERGQGDPAVGESCWRTAGSNCPGWPPTSAGSPGGRCWRR
jgi:hypothetical protein